MRIVSLKLFIDNFKGLPIFGGLHGESNVTAIWTHRFAQNLEMDLSWQELMAITELQEFEVPNENPFEAIPYIPMEPLGPQTGFGMSQPHTGSIAVPTNVQAPGIYENAYPETMPPFPHMDVHYSLSSGACSSRMLTTPQALHQPLMSLLEQMNMTAQSHEIAKGGFHISRQVKPVCTDDLESDSGLSLDSSPPLPSPEVHGLSGYLPGDDMLGYSEVKIGSMGEHSRMQHSLLGNYQQSYNPYPGASFQTSANVQHVNQETHRPIVSMKQQVLPSAMDDVHLHASRLGSFQSPFPKSKPSCVPLTLSRDERRAHALKIPFSMEKIVNLPVDDFNELLTQFTLTDSQLALVRDIRRRGKNKVAAQNCRKRKLDNIVHLETELGQLKAQKEHLARERLEFQQNLALVRCRLSEIYTKVFSQLRDEDGNPYSVHEYSLQQTNDGNIYLVPHNTALEIVTGVGKLVPGELQSGRLLEQLQL
ncbi:hypothetical protein DNTS_015575 [Danionella cerebrum]|uniref:BZIP domain-containing protein n=1 Tax=Danionella cerebrum TaxID=2873325 RepID=A0A553R1Q4_9TELE|nr:hypothetical protein DNTS_015575 [Danionella translucida]